MVIKCLLESDSPSLFESLSPAFSYSWEEPFGVLTDSQNRGGDFLFLPQSESEQVSQFAETVGQLGGEVIRFQDSEDLLRKVNEIAKSNTLVRKRPSRFQSSAE